MSDDHLNAQPLVYDYRRIRYLPEYIFDCGHCQEPLQAFQDAMVVPASPFHRPGMATLLCDRCAGLWCEAERRADQP